MNMNKSPISLLQEICVSRNIVPDYVFTDKGNFGSPLFECVVTAGQIQARGVASNKKEAKNISANNALMQLKEKSEIFVTSSNNNSITSINKNVPFVNYIGYLNEFASKNCLSYATYIEKLSVEGFCCECIFANNQTIGYGPNKKTAKQEAAKQMYDIIHKLDIKYSITKNKDAPKVTVLNEEHVTKKFRELSMTLTPEIKETKEYKGMPSNPELKESLSTIEEMLEELKQFGVNKTSITNIRTTPKCVMKLSVDDNCVLMDWGDNEKEATFKLLKKALRILKYGTLSTFDQD